MSEAVIETTKFGFNWGAAKVERITDDLPHGGVVIGIGIVGKAGTIIDIYVSEKGRSVRVWKEPR